MRNAPGPERRCGRWSTLPRSAAAAMALAAVMTVQTAFAHALHIFAYAEGTVIHGSVSGGGNVAAGVPVRILAPDGSIQGETVTDDDGQFRYRAASAGDFRIIADTVDGHRAEFAVTVGNSPPSAQGPQAMPADWEAALARQVGPLRMEIAQLRERVWIRDVLGGIGYILGLAGIAAALLSRRRS